MPKSLKYILFLSWVPLYFSQGADYIIRWGTEAGPNSAIYDGFGSAWTNNPSPVQLLKDFSDTALINSTGGPDSSWNKGDLIELGFFADLGDDNALGGSGPNADSASTTLFSGSWLPVTSETYIGQDWGDGTPSTETVPAGEFGFATQFTNNGSWSANAVSNQAAESNFQIKSGDDTPANLTTILALLQSTTTPLGMRFYDSTSKSEGVTSYNTIMNSSWTWPSASNTLEMTLHTDTASTNNLNSNLRFEFDNTNYGTNNGAANNYAKKSTSDTAVSTTAIPGTATNPTADDFVTTITYFSSSYLNSNDLDLSDSGGKGSMVVSGLSGTSDSYFVNGGLWNGSGSNAEEHQLTINTSTSNSYTYAGGIAGAANGSSSTDLSIMKTGAGTQTLTGSLNLTDVATDSASSGFINIVEGTLILKPASGKNQTMEYFTGAGTLQLDNTSNSSMIVAIGLANTTSKQTLSGNVALSGSDTNTIDVGGGALAGFGKHQEFSGVVSGAANLKKTGSGKLTLSGNNTFSGGVTIADGGGTKDGGILVAGHANSLGTGTTIIEHGKVAIGAGTTVTTTIQGQGTNDNTNMKSVIGGGVGNSAGVIDNGSGTQINIGSGNGQIDVLSPGIAHASSMSNGTSDYQVVGGNHNASGNDDLTLSIGTVQIDKIGLKNGGVFDWEITDFAGNNSDGSDWDVLKFDDLDFSESDTFDLNIYSLASNGSAGGVSVDGSNHLYSSKAGTSGFKFMEWTTSGSGWNNAPGSARVVNGFNINSDNWAGVNNFYYGDWSVWYESGNFYLQYSAVPEPSTYFMVTGLLMLPGYNFFRRFRKKKSMVKEGSTDIA